MDFEKGCEDIFRLKVRVSRCWVRIVLPQMFRYPQIYQYLVSPLENINFKNQVPPIFLGGGPAIISQFVLAFGDFAYYDRHL